MRRIAPVVLGCALLGSACSLPTLNLLGAQTGSTELTAIFDDTQDVVVGHTVQVANVKIGSVTKVELVKCEMQGPNEVCGPPDQIQSNVFKSRLTLSIVDGRKIPVGTKARVHRTSILGEHYVDLEYPPPTTFDAKDGPWMKSGDRISDTVSDPDFEDLALKAGQVVAAVSADDLAQTVEALHQGLNGKGPELNHLIATLANVAGALDAQQPDLVRAVDGLGRLGQTLAPASDTIGALIDDLANASVSLNQNRDRVIGALTALRDLAQTTNDIVLVPHADRLHTLLAQLADVSGTLVNEKGTLESLISNLLTFTERIDDAVRNGSVLLFGWFDVGSL